MARYFLSRHVYACETDGHAVFLDLIRDKYTAVPPEGLPQLREVVHGWQPCAERTYFIADRLQSATLDRSGSDSDPEIVETLIKEGLLTEDASCGKNGEPPQIEMPTSTLWPQWRPGIRVSAKELPRFVRAWATTTIRLRTQPISAVALRARQLRERVTSDKTPVDVRKARELVTAFAALRPIFYSSEDSCLRNSLTLLEFLSRDAIYPTCVFGVRMDPFSAHAWLQHGQMVFTDSVEHVKCYAPIMQL